MENNNNPGKKHTEGKTELRRVLSLSSLVFYGLAFMIPLTIFTTYGIVTKTTHGMVALTYLLTTACMIFIAFSYVRMVRAYPVAGSVYTYVSKSISPYLGFLSGWTIIIGYMFLPMLNYVISSLFLAAAIPQIPAYVWIVLFIIVVSVINHFGIQVADVANKTIVYLQIIFLVAFMIIMLRFILGNSGLSGMFNFQNIYNAANFGGSGSVISVLLSGASILALSFLGFDAISTLSEEAIDPKKNIPKAILIACIGSGVTFMIVTYFMQAAWPNAWFQIKNPDSGSFEFITKVAGSLMAYIFTAVFTVGCIASSISSVASASRILYSMGRDNILPEKVFGYLHPKYQTPTNNIIIVGVVSLLAIVVSLTTAASLVNFGALLGFTMVNVSVIAHYFVRGKQRSGMNIIRYLVAPGIGGIISFAIWLNIDPFSKMIGFAWIIIGLIYLAATTNFFRKLPKEMDM